MQCDPQCRTMWTEMSKKKEAHYIAFHRLFIIRPSLFLAPFFMNAHIEIPDNPLTSTQNLRAWIHSFSPLDFLWSILQTLESKSRDQIPPIIRLLWGMIVQTWRKCHDKKGRRAPQGHQSSHLKATTNSLLLSKKETKLPLLKEASWWCQTLVY